MRSSLVSLMILCLLPTAMATPNSGYADLVERIQDGVVRIDVTQKASVAPDDPFSFLFQGQRFRQQMPKAQPQQGSGTGFVISADGYIVTNRHVVADSSEVKVQLGKGKTYNAKVIGIDDSLDIALIKVDGANLTALKIGNSDAMRIGDTVLALGFPLQLGFSVTRGIISGMGRDMNTNLDVASYFQTDADITFGNSGGPLVNENGEVIAINTMIVTRGETYGFSIPSKLFMNSIDQLRDHGNVKRGALGVQIQNLDEESKEYYKLDSGVLVGNVTQGMAAQKAGVREGDIILAIDGKQVSASNDVISEVGRRQPGDKIKLRTLSAGKEVTRDVVLSDRTALFGKSSSSLNEAPEVADASHSGLGFKVEALTPQIRSQLNLDSDLTGVIISDVDENSQAAQKGIRPGTILTSINDKPVNSPEDVARLTKPIENGKPASVRLLEISRDSDGDSRSNRLVFLRKQ